MKTYFMKRMYYLLICLFTFIWSCKQDPLSTNLDSPKVILSQEEYLSVAFESPRNLSESEILQLVKDFRPIKDLSRSETYSFSIKRTYHLSSSHGQHDNEILLYDINVQNGNKSGLVVVAADERVQGVIAYIPEIHEKGLNENNNLMLELAQKAVLRQIEIIDSLELIMKDRTLEKLAKELEIPGETLIFNDIKQYVSIQKREISRSKPSDNITTNVIYKRGAFLDVDWGQTEPYNSLLPTYSNPDFDWITNHYPLGSSVTALLMIYSHYEPTITLSNNQIIDWAYLKENRQIKAPTYGVTGDPQKKLDMIAQLSLMIYQETGSTTTVINGVAITNTNKNRIIENLNKHHMACNPVKTYNSNELISSLKSFDLAIIGAKSSGGEHEWVIDGYLQTQIPSANPNLIYYNNYVHANMGWNGTDNGWYLLNQIPPSFETINGNYDKDVWMICNIQMNE